MQITMNSNQGLVSKTTSFFSWISGVTKKVASVFKKKESSVVDKELSEAIASIEWRTKYDQQRIVRYVHTASFLKSPPELYQALGMSLPVKHAQCDRKVNIKTTDNTFERKLFRWFGDLQTETRQLLNGEKTETQRFREQTKRITELFPMIASKSPKNTYEQQILSALAAQAIVHVAFTSVYLETSEVSDDSEASILRENNLVTEAIVVLDTTPKIPEFIEVTAETLLTETVVVDTTPSTDTEPSAIASKKTSINKLTIKELKSYAKRHKIYIPGKVTKVKQMKEIVIAAQSGSAKIRD